MINYKIKRFYTILLITFLIAWFIFLILAVLMIVQDKVSRLPYLLGIFGIAEFVLLFLAGVYCMLFKKKAIDYADDGHEEIFDKLKQKAIEAPEKINIRMIRLYYYGNLYVAVMIITILLTILGLISIGIQTGSSMGGFGTFVMALLSILYILFRSIYIKPEYPEGITADAESNPEIFRVLDSAIRDTNAEQIDKIYITEDANAAVCFIPSGFGFGGKSLMQMGILLLSILEEEELKSVIIHELSHIYNKDTRISSKISYNIIRWMRIIERSENIVAHVLLIPFAESYIDTMQLHLAAISKTRETIADKEAATFTSKQTYAIASMKLELLDLYRDDAYAMGEIRMRTEPPHNFYSLLLTSFYDEFANNYNPWINQIKKRISSIYDTHPSFKERMQALGIENYSYPVVFRFENNSYRKEIQALLDAKNQEFFEALSENWSEYTEEYQAQLEIVKNFKESDDPDSNLKYAMALEETGNRDEAYSVYNKIISKQADYSPALYRLGQLLLHKNDGSGIDYVKKAIELNTDFIIPGLSLIGEYLMSNGLTEERDMLMPWMKQKSMLADKIQEETNRIDIKDIFIESDLEQDKLEKIKDIIKENNKITRAYFVKKQMQFSSENCYVLALSFHSLLSKNKARASIQDMTEKVGDLGVSCFIMDLNDNPTFYRSLKQVPNSNIFTKK